MAHRSDVVVVGGGMAGCLAAHYLLEAGASVVLLERTSIGTQASGNSAGGLNPLHGPGIPGPLSPLAMESYRLHRELWQLLEGESGIEFFPRKVQRLFLAFSEGELPSLRASQARYEESEGFAASLIEGAEVARLEPRINREVVAALFTEGNAAVEPQAYCEAIAAACVDRGARIVHATARGLLPGASSDHIGGVATDSGDFPCDDVVLATGPWGSELSAWLDVPLPVTPLKGEMLLVALPGPHLQYDFTYANRSLFVRGKERVWVGATATSEGYDVGSTETAQRELSEAGVKIMPVVADAHLVEHTVGLRPATPDNLPIVGRAPGWANVYLSLGAGTKGTLISAGMGKAAADLIINGSTDLSIGCADPGRFETEGSDDH